MVCLKTLTVTPNAASFATPYASGDVIGGINKIAGGVLNSGAAAILKSLTVLDKSNQKAAVDIVFLDSAPANSFGADNSSYALNDADLFRVLGRISVAQADYVSSSTNNAEATKSNLIQILAAAAGSKDLYCIVVSRGTPTYGSASDLSVRLGIEQYE